MMLKLMIDDDVNLCVCGVRLCLLSVSLIFDTGYVSHNQSTIDQRSKTTHFLCSA